MSQGFTSTVNTNNPVNPSKEDELSISHTDPSKNLSDVTKAELLLEEESSAVVSNKSTPSLDPSLPGYSYLNNDGIDQLQPTRRKRVSSLSLSDQWNSNLQLSGLSRSNSIKKSSSRLSMTGSLRSSRRPSLSMRYKKSLIDHERVASYAFAFDIDGVIVKGPDTIPEARELMKLLNGENRYNIKIPYIFVTNGGGRPEEKRAIDLSQRLGVKVDKEQVIQGHTPMKDLVDVHDNVLVVGGVGDTCRKVAEDYGFKNVYIPLDIMKWNPSVSPYHDLTDEEKAVARDVDFSKVNIDAILVFADSRNWAADQQIILELLLSQKGRMGTTSETFDEGPGLYFAHSDFVWATNYKLSRYGMGALQVSIAALYREHTGKELVVTRFGKPQRGTFRFATKILTAWRKNLLDKHVKDQEVEDGERPALFISDSEESDSEEEDEGLNLQKISEIKLDLPPPSTVYFVGDTPESDIRFANSHDESWHSILVKTGVYQPGTEPKYKPKLIVDNVLDAVKYAIEREHQLELDEWNQGLLDLTEAEQNTGYSPQLETIAATPAVEKPQFII